MSLVRSTEAGEVRAKAKFRPAPKTPAKEAPRFMRPAFRTREAKFSWPLPSSLTLTSATILTTLLPYPSRSIRPELFIAGITTVFRDAPRRTLLVRELLRLWGTRRDSCSRRIESTAFNGFVELFARRPQRWQTVRGARPVSARRARRTRRAVPHRTDSALITSAANGSRLFPSARCPTWRSLLPSRPMSCRCAVS